MSARLLWSLELLAVSSGSLEWATLLWPGLLSSEQLETPHHQVTGGGEVYDVHPRAAPSGEEGGKQLCSGGPLACSPASEAKSELIIFSLALGPHSTPEGVM